MDDVLRLDGQVAVVTGASGAIGGAVTCALVEAGCRVVASGRDAGRLDQLVERVAERRAVSTVPADLTAEDTPAVVARAAASLGDGLGLLVHAAGTFAAGPVLEDGRHLEELLRINVLAPVRLTRALLPQLVRSRGSVVFVGSTAATRAARAGTGAYDASKHALRAISDALRAELAQEGVRVLSVHPGRTAGAMQEQVVATEHRHYDPAEHLRPEDVARALLGAVALPPGATVTELVVQPSVR